MKHILDRAFKYTPSFDTDVRKTMERVRKQQEKARAEQQQDSAEAQQKVVATIKPKLRAKT